MMVLCRASQPLAPPAPPSLYRDAGCTPIHTPVVLQILPTSASSTTLGLKPNLNTTAVSTSTTGPPLLSALCSLPKLTGPSDEVGLSPRWCCAELASHPLSMFQLQPRPPLHTLCPRSHVQAMRSAHLLDVAVPSQPASPPPPSYLFGKLQGGQVVAPVIVSHRQCRLRSTALFG